MSWMFQLVYPIVRRVNGRLRVSWKVRDWRHTPEWGFRGVVIARTWKDVGLAKEILDLAAQVGPRNLEQVVEQALPPGVLIRRIGPEEVR